MLVEDEQWWARHGGAIEANWESQRLRRYSSLDQVGLAALAADPMWSNEGLYALLQGLRRLANIGGNRVRLPIVDLE